MKIDLDLSEIYEDEDGHRLHQSFIEQVIESLASKIHCNLEKKVSERIDLFFTEQINKTVSAKMESVLTELLDYEFKPKTNWGSEEKSTTIRNKIIEQIQKETEHKKKDSYYDRDTATALTKVLSLELATQIKPLVDSLRTTINYEFKKECIEAARVKLLEIKDR